jgi:zinc protease
MGLSVVAAGLGCVVRLPAPRRAPPAAPTVAARPLVSRVLPSGLRLVVDRDPDATVVAVASAINAGGVNDPPGKGGLAHLVEHLTFRAVDPGGEGTDRWQRLAHLPLAADVHGATAWERMTFATVAPASSFRNLLAIEAARLVAPLAGVDERTLEIERRVTDDQSHLDDDTAEAVSWSDLLGEDATADERGVDDLGGTDTSRRALSLADARAFARAHFRPENMTLVVAGAVPAAVDDIIAALPDPLVSAGPGGPRPPATLPIPPAPAAVLNPPRMIASVPVPSLRHPTLLITWRLPSLYTPEGPVVAWLPRIADEMLDGHELRRAVPGLIRAHVHLQTTNRASLLVAEVELWGFANPTLAAQVVETAVNRLVFDEREAANVHDLLRRRAVASLNMGGDAAAERALPEALLASALGRPVSLIERTIEQVTLPWNRIYDLARLYLGRPPHRVLRVPAALPSDLPADTPLRRPSADRLSAARSWDAATLAPFARRSVSFKDATRVAMPNGATLIHLRRPGARNVVALLGLHGGFASAFSPSLVRWLDELRPSYADHLDAFGGLAGRGSNNDLSYEVLEVPPDHLTQALPLLVARAAARLERWPDLGDLQRLFYVNGDRDAEPGHQADRAFYLTLYPGHPYGRNESLADAQWLTPAALTSWQSLVAQPANATMIIVGDVDLRAATAAATQALGPWVPAPGQRPIAATPAPTTRASSTGPRTSIVQQAGIRMVTIRLGCQVPAARGQGRAGLSVLAQTIEERLNNDLRHATGDTQGVSVASRSLRGAADLSVSVDVDARRVSTVLATLHRNWTRWGRAGFDEAETNVGRWRVVGAFAGRDEDASEAAFDLIWQSSHGLPLEDLDREAAAAAALRPADLGALFAGCRDNAAMVLIGDPSIVTPARLEAAWPGVERAR